MKTLKLPLFEDRYDTALADRQAKAYLPANQFWAKRLDETAKEHPSEVTYYRGLYAMPGQPRQTVTASVTGITLDAAANRFVVAHDPLDAANQKPEDPQAYP